MNRAGDKLRVNLLIHVHSAGLRRDLHVWKRALHHCGFDFTVTAFNPQFHSRAIRALRKVAGRFAPRPPFDVNVFVEDIAESWCPLARTNVFVPHQEWVFDDLRAKVYLMDYVFCKTHYAGQLFTAIGSDVRYIGFTSVDRYDPDPKKDFNSFLHVAGSSLQKGTSTVNEVWLKHPEWPGLKLLAYEPTARIVPAGNISVVTRYLEEAELRQMQNACGIHLCPSEAEGFGHYLVEAMSTGALVVTTNAPPMNELVEARRGVLVGYNRTAQQGMGTNFYVDPQQLESAVESILKMSEENRCELGTRGKTWYRENDGAFIARLREVLEEVGTR